MFKKKRFNLFINHCWCFSFCMKSELTNQEKIDSMVADVGKYPEPYNAN